MPHRIDIDGISRNLFLLHNLSLASQSYCEIFNVNRCKIDNKFGWDYYLGWLKSNVSEMLIECAIKFRVMQDFLSEEEIPRLDLREAETKVVEGVVIGRLLPDHSPISIREACNKILHAKEVKLTWRDNGSYEYWAGDVQLEGILRGELWVCELYVSNFCIAMESMLGILESKVDWHHLYKYDE